MSFPIAGDKFQKCIDYSKFMETISTENENQNLLQTH